MGSLRTLRRAPAPASSVTHTIDPARDVLIVIDVQNDFCSAGALPVPGGEEIVPLVNRLAQRFDHILLTQDWHPPHHASFASSHPGKVPFDTLAFDYGEQTLWPDHCVQGTTGAAFHPELLVDRAELVVRKGFRKNIDSYSAFYENDHRTSTGLAGYLRDRGFRRAFFCGLATDFCVAWSARDARRLGLKSTVVLDACRAIDAAGSLAASMAAMSSAGVAMITSDRLATV